MDQLKTFACRAIDAHDLELKELGVSIWKYAEPGGREEKSCKALMKVLKDNTFEITEYSWLPTGFIAEFGDKEFGGQKRPNIGIICIYDAPVGKGHVAGNNLVAELAVGMALGLQEVFRTSSSKLGKVTVFGCPNSAKGGLVPLLNRKAFSNVDVVFCAVPGPRTEWCPSYLGTKTFRARYLVADLEKPLPCIPPTVPLNAAVAAYMNIMSIQQYFAKGWRVDAVLSNGGSKVAERVMEGETTVKITVPSGADMDAMEKRIIPCFEAAAKASRCKLELGLAEKTLYNMINNKLLVYCLQLNAYHCGVLATPLKKKEVLAAVDMGNLSRQLPAIRPMFFIGTDSAVGTEDFKQAAGTQIAHQNTIAMAKAMAMTAIDVLLTPGTLIDVKQVHKDALLDTKDHKFKPMPISKQPQAYMVPLARPPDANTGWSKRM